MSIPSDTNNKIALWGPPNSGKTWYILAFKRKLKEYKNDPDFHYNLFNGDQTLGETIQDEAGSKIDVPITINPGEIQGVQGTAGLEDHIWTFKRQKKQDTPSHVFSEYSHTISIVDDRGQSTLDLKSNATVYNLKSANSILMVLDPTTLTTVGGEISGKYTPLDYASRVESFFQLLITAPQPERHVAICINKIDQLHVKQREPEELIQMFFEKEMNSVIQDYKNKFILKLFAVSAAGYIKEGFTSKANFDVTNGQLIDPNNWKPYNVESPLFWLFENIERKKIGRSKEQISGGLGKLLFQSERKNLYIPYPIKNK
jgi:GTPase SAR1 family protein